MEPIMLLHVACCLLPASRLLWCRILGAYCTGFQIPLVPASKCPWYRFQVANCARYRECTPSPQSKNIFKETLQKIILNILDQLISTQLSEAVIFFSFLRILLPRVFNGSSWLRGERYFDFMIRRGLISLLLKISDW